MAFFTQFPNFTYDLQDNNNFINAKNLFRHVDVNDVLAQNSFNYTYYEIQQGERPDIVSQNLYGTPDYYWTFFIVNESLKNGLQSWPKDSSTLEDEMVLEFDPYGALVCVPHMASSFSWTQDGSPSVINSDRITNTYNGIDLSLADLRAKRNGALARIYKWDTEKLQLIVGDFVTQEWNDGLHLMADGTNMRGSTHVPSDSVSAQAKNQFFDGSPKEHDITLSFYDSPFTTDRVNFVKKLTESVTKSFVDQNILVKYDYLPENEYNEANSPDGSPTKVSERLFPYNASPNEGLNFAVTPSRTYQNLRSAPEYYYANNDTSNVISAFEAFSGDSTNPGGSYTIPADNSPDVGDQFTSKGADIFVTRGKHLIDTEFENRKIKVIQPEYIAEFAREYKRLINS